MFVIAHPVQAGTKEVCDGCHANPQDNKKVIDIITRIELQLAHLLMENAPESLASAAAQVATASVAEPVTVDNQSDVNDLLAPLGSKRACPG
jgi:chemotaxis regulatin CheY-phosphate phosphatase CheZ